MILLILLLLPALAQAAGEGAWQTSGNGITLYHPGVSASSAPLSPPQPASGLMTLVAWRAWHYTLIGAPGYGRGYARAASLLRGRTERLWRLATLPPRNHCAVSGKYPAAGGLIPALKVQSNQVIVNYR